MYFRGAATGSAEVRPIFMEQEEEVVAHAQKVPEAFGRLYDVYYQPVFGFLVKRTGNMDVAKDLTSEAFFQALKNIHRYHPRPGRSFKSWLFAIVIAQVGNYYRGRQKLLSLSSEACPELVAEPDGEPGNILLAAEEQAERETQVRKLRRLLNTLNPRQQNILSLRYFSQLSIAEIARAMNMKEGTIKSHIHRAIHKLSTLMTSNTHVESPSVSYESEISPQHS